MKRSYTTYQPFIKSRCKHFNRLDLLAQAVQDFPYFPKDFSVYYNSLQTASQMIVWNELNYLRGSCLSLYLPSQEFCDWLVSCVNRSDYADYYYLLKESLGVLSCFHFPCESKMEPFLLALYTEKEVAVSIRGQINRDGCGFVINGMGKGKPGSLCFGFNKNPEGITKESEYQWRLVTGIAMYMSCFPNALINGVPSDLKHPSHHKGGTRKTIEICSEIKSQHCSPVGHFRSGHFRVLRSEKFKNKRFQVIFIKETFVNGKAATVQSFEDMDAASG